MIMDKKETNISLFSTDQIDRLNIPELEFIQKLSADYLSDLNHTANRITERAYTLIGFMIAACPLLAGFLSYNSINLTLIGSVVLFLVISGCFIFVTTKPYRFACGGMIPSDVVYFMNMNEPNLHKETLLLSIYTNQNNIDFTLKMNKKRIRYYLIGIVILPSSIIFGTFLILFH